MVATQIVKVSVVNNTYVTSFVSQRECLCSSVSKSNFHAYNKLRSEVLLAEVWLTSVAMCHVPEASRRRRGAQYTGA